jgi:alpha/beta superfamily hydrolase
LSEHYPRQEITLAGFSFGARVGLEVGVSDARVARLISLGTPVDKYDFTFLENCRKPILFVHGDRDEFGQASTLSALVNRLPAEAHARLEIIKGAGHFFEGHLDEMKQVITEWTNERMKDEGGRMKE